LADSALACFRMGMSGSRDIVLISDAGNKLKDHSAFIGSDWQLGSWKGAPYSLDDQVLRCP